MYTVKMCLYTGKEIIYKTEKQWADWEKLFANDILDKGLISKIYKYVIELSIKNTKQSNLKKDRGPNKQFFQRTHADGQQPQEEMLNIANQQGNEIKTTWDITSHHSESVQFSHSIMSDSLRPHKSQHARPPCPSPTHGVH